MSNYQGRLSSRQLTIFIYFYSHWHFFNIFVTVWQPWAIISLRQNSGHTVTLKISYSSTENQKKISKLKICLAGPSDPSETISSDLIKVCCLSMSNFSNVNNSPFRQVECNCEGLDDFCFEFNLVKNEVQILRQKFFFQVYKSLLTFKCI